MILDRSLQQSEIASFSRVGNVSPFHSHSSEQWRNRKPWQLSDVTNKCPVQASMNNVTSPMKAFAKREVADEEMIAAS